MLHRIFAIILCVVFMSSYLSFPVYADYDLGDYDYTPVARPDYKQYPKTSDGFGAYCKDFALYCAAGTYDNTVQFITSFNPLSNQLDDLTSYFGDDIVNSSEVFRRLLFPNSAFSPFYDPYYERDFHVSGTPGSAGSEEYVWGDGILRFSYDFDRFYDTTLHYYSSISDFNNIYDANIGRATPLYTMVSYNLPGSGSAVWYRPHGIFNADWTERHYSGSVSNPRVNFSVDPNTGDVTVSVSFDYVLTYLNTDDQSTWTETYLDQSCGSPLAILKAGDPHYDEVHNILTGVPRLLITPPTDDNIDDTPYCNLYSPDSPSFDPVPYYYYIDDNGNYYLTPDPVLPSYPQPDNAIPISPDGTVNIGGNIYMPINVLSSFNSQIQSIFSVALTSYYTNIFVGMGGNMSNCGCPDYSNWLNLINSRLGTIDYDLYRIYDLLLKIYNKQSGDLPELDLPDVPDLTPTVVIQDFASIIYDRINPAPLFKGLSTILSFMFDGWVDPIGDNFFDISNYFDPDNSVSVSSVVDDPQVYNDSAFISLASEGSVSPSFPVQVGDYEIDLMSWYSPDLDPQLAVGKNFMSIILVCGWIMWFIRQIPSLFGSVSTVDRGGRDND